jgi:predicted nucleic acid-binding protein
MKLGIGQSRIDFENFECDRIEKLSANPDLLPFLHKLNIPNEIIQNLYFFTIPESKYQIYEMQYALIQEENPFRTLPFSLDDWILAYIAAENMWGVVSFDHHLLYAIQKFLDFIGYHPADVKRIPADSMVLLDTNILYQFQDPTDRKCEDILHLIKGNPSVTFLISENIFNELTRLYWKKLKQAEKTAKIFNEKYESKENLISEFIDDYERFESRKAQKKRKKAQINRYSRRYYTRKTKWERYIDS